MHSPSDFLVNEAIITQKPQLLLQAVHGAGGRTPDCLRGTLIHASLVFEGSKFESLCLSVIASCVTVL